MDEKKVLVMMTTYNGENYLDEQLSSLFSQKKVKVKVLVRDDGSSDQTIKILNDWQNKEDLNWYTGQHLNTKYGFFDLLEKAIDYNYEFFAFCDQDDVWDDDKLISAVKELSCVKNGLEGLYYCGQRLVDENLNLLSIHELNEKRTIYARFLLNDAAGCTQVFNKPLLKRIIAYKPSYMLMHDAWIVKVCLAVGGKIIVDTKPHISYRQHTNNVVGLQNNFKSKLKRAQQYIYEQDIESQMRELRNGYGENLTPEFGEIINNILLYKEKNKYKLKLLNLRKFKFGDLGITITYILKLFLNKL